LRLKKLEQFCKVTVLFISTPHLVRITKRNKTRETHLPPNAAWFYGAVLCLQIFLTVLSGLVICGAKLGRLLVQTCDDSNTNVGDFLCVLYRNIWSHYGHSTVGAQEVLCANVNIFCDPHYKQHHLQVCDESRFIVQI